MPNCPTNTLQQQWENIFNLRSTRYPLIDPCADNRVIYFGVHVKCERVKGISPKVSRKKNRLALKFFSLKRRAFIALCNLSSVTDVIKLQNRPS